MCNFCSFRLFIHKNTSVAIMSVKNLKQCITKTATSCGLTLIFIIITTVSIFLECTKNMGSNITSPLESVNSSLNFYFHGYIFIEKSFVSNICFYSPIYKIPSNFKPLGILINKLILKIIK